MNFVQFLFGLVHILLLLTQDAALVARGECMKCSHCSFYFRDNWEPHHMLRNDRGTTWVYRTAECPACAELTVEIGRTDANGELVGG
jgi:hypothetical protein